MNKKDAEEIRVLVKDFIKTNVKALDDINTIMKNNNKLLKEMLDYIVGD